ncbi:hypothetical protein DFH06DRAFT_1226673 [Mycena polygramma]|nr:hypothetical protein DFH06DRAFT_1226673 [Mycena polygramma]
MSGARGCFNCGGCALSLLLSSSTSIPTFSAFPPSTLRTPTTTFTYTRGRFALLTVFWAFFLSFQFHYHKLRQSGVRGRIYSFQIISLDGRTNS